MTVDTPAWVRDAVFYQIFPDRFASSGRVPKPGRLEDWDQPPTIHGFKGGDLIGIVEHLDYLQELGITAIYMTPIFQSASNHRYHTYDYFHVDPLLGGDDALRELLDDAHGRGMRIVLDGVFNHTGRGFWPFHHIVENGAASPYRDWFHLDPEVLAGSRELLPYPPRITQDASLLGYRAWWGLPALPKLNTGNPDVREFIYSVAEYWLRFGIDGWRLDVPAEIDDAAFWAAFRQRCRAIRSDAYLVGEIWKIAPDWVGEGRFDALMDYPLAEAILGYVGGRTLDMSVIQAHHEYRHWLRPLDGPGFAARLVELLGVYEPDVVAVQLNLLGSHDAPRPLTVVGGDRAALRLATLVQMTLPGAPSIYYGDEIGMTGEQDPANRGAFPWDDPGRWDGSLLADISAAARLRHEHPVLRRGATRIVAAESRTVAYLRWSGGEAALVVVNAGDEPSFIDLVLPELEGRSLQSERWSTTLAGPTETRIEVRDHRVTIALPPRDGALFLT